MLYLQSRSELLHRWLLPLGVAAAVVSIGVSLGHFAHTVLYAGRLATPEAIATAGAQQHDVPGIARRGWFGMAPEDDAAPGQTSNLVLKGVSQSDDPALAGAFIAVKGAEEAYYKRGDAMPGNAGVLEEVFSDSVTIRNGEELIRLGFGDAVPVIEPPAKSSAVISAEKEALIEQIQKEPDTQLANDAAKAFAEHPAESLKKAGLEVVEPGKEAGYRFNGNDEKHVFDGAGLQQGDVIVSANNIPVGNVNNDILMLPNLIGLRTLYLGVRRGDKEIILEYHMP